MNFAFIQSCWNFVQLSVNANVEIAENMVILHSIKPSQPMIFTLYLIFFLLVTLIIWRVRVYNGWAIIENVCVFFLTGHNSIELAQNNVYSFNMFTGLC